MQKKLFTFVIACVAAVLMLTTVSWNIFQDRKDIQAVLIKVVRDVERKAPAAAWQKAIPLDQLRSGYEVRTDPKSLALVLFPDQSKVVVRERSTITIHGEVQGRQILNRNVHINRGGVLFDVKKQETEQFRFTSPISVASVRGSSGGNDFEPADSTSKLTMTEGACDFTNTTTGESQTVTQGNTATTGPDQPINVGESTSQDTTGFSSELAGSVEGDTGEPTTAPTETQVTTTTPALTVTLVLSGLKSGQETTVTGEITGADTASGVLRFKMQEAPTYDQASLTISKAGDRITFQGKIPGDRLRGGKLQYYFEFLVGNQTKTVPENGAAEPNIAEVAFVDFLIEGVGMDNQGNRVPLQIRGKK